MATLREIRRRIKSVKSTAQITKAMELVAASKMRRAQERVLASRPYAEKMHTVLGDLSADTVVTGQRPAPAAGPQRQRQGLPGPADQRSWPVRQLQHQHAIRHALDFIDAHSVTVAKM